MHYCSHINSGCEDISVWSQNHSIHSRNSTGVCSWVCTADQEAFIGQHSCLTGGFSYKKLSHILLDTRKSSVSAERLLLRNYGSPCALANLSMERNVFVALPRFVPPHIAISPQAVLWFVFSRASSVRARADRCRAPSQIMSNYLNWTQMDSNQGVKTSQRWSRGQGDTWAKCQVSTQRLRMLMSKRLFIFFILVNIQKYINPLLVLIMDLFYLEQGCNIANVKRVSEFWILSECMFGYSAIYSKYNSLCQSITYWLMFHNTV